MFKINYTNKIQDSTKDQVNKYFLIYGNYTEAGTSLAILQNCNCYNIHEINAMVNESNNIQNY